MTDIEYTPGPLLTAAQTTRTALWNDSADLDELRQSISFGGVGATCNPVIAYTVIRNHMDVWVPRILAIAEAHHLDAEIARALLAGRLQLVEAKAVALRAGHARASNHAAEARILDIDYLAAMAEAEAAWLRGVLTRLDDHTLQWKAPHHGE